MKTKIEYDREGNRTWFKLVKPEPLHSNGLVSSAYFEVHREDGPAIMYNDGSEEWFLNGKLHREDGPAITGSGVLQWYFEGKLHRENGPAIDNANGLKLWYNHGDLHREDGPAIEYIDGTGSYWLNNTLCTEEQAEHIKHTAQFNKNIIEALK